MIILTTYVMTVDRSQTHTDTHIFRVDGVGFVDVKTPKRRNIKNSIVT